MDDLVDRLDAASRDERLADGMLYREAAKRIIALTIDHARYWHKIMQRTDKQADRIAELEAELKAWKKGHGIDEMLETSVKALSKAQSKLDRVRGLLPRWREGDFDLPPYVKGKMDGCHQCANELESAL